MSVCIHCIVEGKVQGVFFRDSTMRMAQVFGVSGWVRNMSDGNVEVFACGEQQDVDKLRTWLSQGPVTANVTNVSCEQVAYEVHDEFVVRR